MSAKLDVDLPELRSQMGRANLTQSRLSELAGVHTNTVWSILKGRKKPDLDTIGAIVLGLNEALESEGQQKLHPFDIIECQGFPSPQVDAPITA